jgi:hypothetical protein
VPIVMAVSSDGVGAPGVASLARPGASGNPERSNVGMLISFSAFIRFTPRDRTGPWACCCGVSDSGWHRRGGPRHDPGCAEADRADSSARKAVGVRCNNISGGPVTQNMIGHRLMGLSAGAQLSHPAQPNRGALGSPVFFNSLHVHFWNSVAQTGPLCCRRQLR